MPTSDVLLPNEAELRAIVGRSEIADALRALPCDVVVKRGAAGAIARFGDIVVEIPARAAGWHVVDAGCRWYQCPAAP